MRRFRSSWVAGGLGACCAAFFFTMTSPAPAAGPASAGPHLAGAAPTAGLVPVFFGRGEREDAARAQAQAQANSMADLQFRVDSLESQMRTLTGQIEEMSHRLRQIDQRLGGAPADAAPNPAEPPRAQPDGGAIAPGANSSREEGAPPAVLGQLPGGSEPSGEFASPQIMEGLPQAPLSVADGARAPGQADGAPVDLAAISRAIGDPTSDSSPAQPVALPDAPSGSVRDEYDLAYGYILRADYEMAEASFRRFLENHDEDALAGNAQFWLGEALAQRGEHREAADAFLSVYTKHGDSAKAADSLAKLGVSLAALEETEAACATFSEFGRQYPRASEELKREVEAGQSRASC